MKMAMAFCTKLEQIILKFVWNHERPLITKVILKKEEQCWRYHAPCFQTILQSHSNQNSKGLTQKQTHISIEQNREPRNGPRVYGQLICYRGGNYIQRGKDNFLNKWCWENWTATCKTIYTF